MFQYNVPKRIIIEERLCSVEMLSTALYSIHLIIVIQNLHTLSFRYAHTFFGASVNLGAEDGAENEKR